MVGHFHEEHRVSRLSFDLASDGLFWLCYQLVRDGLLQRNTLIPGLLNLNLLAHNLIGSLNIPMQKLNRLPVLPMHLILLAPGPFLDLSDKLDTPDRSQLLVKLSVLQPLNFRFKFNLLL